MRRKVRRRKRWQQLFRGMLAQIRGIPHLRPSPCIIGFVVNVNADSFRGGCALELRRRLCGQQRHRGLLARSVGILNVPPPLYKTNVQVDGNCGSRSSLGSGSMSYARRWRATSASWRLILVSEDTVDWRMPPCPNPSASWEFSCHRFAKGSFLGY